LYLHQNGDVADKAGKRGGERAPAGRQEIRDRIRDAGLRATPGRLATYQVLRAASSPLTHSDVVAKLELLGLDRATVYRNLMDLTEAGLVSRSDHGDRTWRFELGNEGHHPADHVHFVCIDCGDVACLDGVDVKLSTSHSAPRSVTERNVEVQLRGRCDNCA
jgi:Fur family ferric uptake transcriptional regulator